MAVSAVQQIQQYNEHVSTLGQIGIIVFLAVVIVGFHLGIFWDDIVADRKRKRSRKPI